MKKLFSVIPLVCLLCFAFGCQDKAAMAELEQFKAQAAVEEQNRALVLKWYEEWTKGNLEAVLEMFAPNLLWYSPSNSPNPMSRDESRGFLEMLLVAFPKWTVEIEEIFAVGNKVVIRAIDRTTHEGEFQGIPATGNEVEFGAVVIYSVENGKIVEMREEEDSLGIMMQLGMELKPKEAEK